MLRHRVVLCCRPVDPLVDRIHGFLGECWKILFPHFGEMARTKKIKVSVKRPLIFFVFLLRG